MCALRTFALGALAFWVPDVLVHVVAGHYFGKLAVLFITIMLPMTALLAFERIDTPGFRTVQGWPRAYLMLLGIWFLGPVFMMISATYLGGRSGFLAFSKGTDWLILFNPVGTFIMATYDGALGALVFTTILLPLASVFFRKRTD